MEDTGENISSKKPNTALYSIWKNEADHYGLFHYIHEPNISRHHKKYVKDGDGAMTMNTLRGFYPDYHEFYQEVLQQNFYAIIIFSLQNPKSLRTTAHGFSAYLST